MIPTISLLSNALGSGIKASNGREGKIRRMLSPLQKLCSMLTV